MRRHAEHAKTQGDIMKPVRRLLVAAITALTLAAPLAACGNSGNDVYEPAAWGPSYAGQTYCAYTYSPLECAGHPGIPAQMPVARPMVSDLLATALWVHLLTYPTFYHSGYYYDRYVTRSHVTIVNRTTYINQGRTFDKTNAAGEAHYDKTAKYRGPGGKTYTGNKYGGMSKSTGVVKRKSGGDKGGNAGTVSDPGKKPGTVTGGAGAKNPPVKTSGGVTRKTGSGTSGGSKTGTRTGGYSGGSRTGGRR
jgi:hypothetical protein